MWIHFAGKRVPKKEKALPMLTERLKALLKAEASVGTPQGGEPPPLPPGDAGVRVAVERAAACLLANESAGAKQACARAPASAAAAAARASASFGSTRRRWRPCARAAAERATTVFENNVDLHEAIKGARCGTTTTRTRPTSKRATAT